MTTEEVRGSLPVAGVVRWGGEAAGAGEVNVVLSGAPEPSPMIGEPLPAGH